MEQIVMTLPVILPWGSEARDQPKGQAVITDMGAMVITFDETEHAERLVDHAKEGILYEVRFSYRTAVRVVVNLDEGEVECQPC